MGRRGSGIAVTGAVIFAVAATSFTGTPKRVPDIALDSALLFHLERTVALLAGFLVVLVTITRAWSGELPAELSTQGLKYGEAGQVAASAFSELDAEVASLRRFHGATSTNRGPRGGPKMTSMRYEATSDRTGPEAESRERRRRIQRAAAILNGGEAPEPAATSDERHARIRWAAATLSGGKPHEPAATSEERHARIRAAAARLRALGA
jgi:hypothetical protein